VERRTEIPFPITDEMVFKKFGGGPKVETFEPCSEELIGRGVDVEWLLAWTEAHDLWDMKTEDVVNQIVKPLTLQHMCRFVELSSQFKSGSTSPLMSTGFQSRSVVGRAHCFASHCWQSPFGDLVAAASENSRPGRKI